MPQTDFASLLTARGYQVIAEQQPTGRFSTLKIMKAGQLYFAKAVNDVEPEQIQTEIAAFAQINNYAAKNQNFHAVSPTIIESGEDWYISTFFDAPMLFDGIPSKDGIGAPVISRLAEILLQLDQLNSSEGINAQPLVSLEELFKKHDSWLEQAIHRGDISTADVQAGKDLVKRSWAQVEPSFQHGDFVPWHMFELGNGQTGIIDAEHASSSRPRFYDLAYLYTRLYTRSELNHEPRVILNQVVDGLKIQPDVLHPKLLPVMILRTFGMFFDAIADEKPGDSYMIRAQELLRMCLRDDISEFL